MLTKERAIEMAALMTDAALDRASDLVTGRHDDDDVLGVAAVLERGRRREKSEAAAALAAPALAAEQAARAAYDAAGLPAAGFKAWYEVRLAKETGEKLDQQRAAAAYIAARRF